MPRIVINNAADLKNLQTKIKALKIAFPFIQKKAILQVSTDDVLKTIHRKMKLNDFSSKIIDATFVGATTIQSGISKTHFISNYVAPENDFDVSVAREEGTKSGITRRPKKPGGVLRWVAKSGEVIFRKKATPKGIERLLIIEKTLKEKQNTIQKEVGEAVGKEASKILGV